MTRAAAGEPASPHRLIHASAGTGKTWQLSGRYLQLVAQGVEPRRILATTFTRKAAGEIQDRVLERLARACVHEKDRRELAEQLGRPLSSEDARALLVGLTRRLGELRVRTLDAFFVHLAKLFALDLGLPPDWSIVEEAEDEALRREALARALARTERLELIALLRGLQQGEASRFVERVLLTEVAEGRDAFLDSTVDAWRRIAPPPAEEGDDLEAALRRFGDLEMPTTARGTPRAHWVNAHAAILERIEGGEWQALMDQGLVKRVAERGVEFAGAEITPEWSACIEVFMRAAARELVREVALFNAAAVGWLERFEASYEELKAEERAYRFEDLPKALHPREENLLPAHEHVWYRLDGKLDHVLLDEFQDTAPVQWRILAPLVEEILADGTGTRSFFCVGDLKQSIYGWREAEPRLLAGMQERYPVLEAERLARSYRSSSVVLDTVDRAFARIGSNPAFDRPERVAAAEGFQADFDRPEAARDLPGAAFLVEAPEDDDQVRATLALAAERARAIANEAPHATIGILVRRNTLIPQLVYLLREHDLIAGGEGGNPLTDSMAVLHFLSLLHLADHPRDSAAAFHVATSPLGPEVGLTREGYREQAAEVSRVTRRRLALQGYGAMATAFLGKVDEGYGSWDRRRFRQLVDLAWAHDERAGPRADAFVDHVRITRVEDPAATQVQVMTVHAAKGLEFDAVILPELDMKFALRETALLTQRPDPAGCLTVVSHARSEAVCRMHHVLSGMWSERAEREMREALCLLYVAMTRARRRIDMIVQHKKDPARIRHSFAGILRAALGAGMPDEHGVLWRHPESSEAWAPPAPEVPPPAAGGTTTSSPGGGDDGVFRRSGPPRELPHRTPSAGEGGGVRRAGDLLRSPRSEARVRGELVHEWLSAVEWLEDFRADDAALRERGRGITRDEALLASALAELRGYLGRPTVAAELSLGSAPRAERTVWRERPFSLVLDGEDGGRELWAGAFDRVVLHGEPGAWTAATIVDFKTDRVGPGDIDARVEVYRPQMEGYRRVLAHLLGLDPGRIAARLLFLRPDAVREV